MPRSLLRRLGFRLLPLLHPTRDEDRRRIEQLAAAVDSLREIAQRDREERKELRRDVRQAQERLGTVRGELAAGFSHGQQVLEAAQRELASGQRDSARRIHATISRQSTFLKGVLRHAHHLTEHAVRQQHVLERLGRAAASGRPIVVGPWTGEVGFELIYWIPFVRWFLQHFAVDPARLIVVSRGGPVSWYGELAGRYVDVLELVAPHELADSGRGRVRRKQRGVSDRDRKILRSVAARVGRPLSVLHPSYLYALCAGYLDGYVGVRPLMEILRPRRIVAPAVTLVPGLPPEFIAAKFYFSAAFPDTTENRRVADTLLARVSERYPVVLLDHGSAVDDHRPYGSGGHHTLASLGAVVTPRNNLEVQTAVVSRARAFVGTYGGFAYFAPLCGVSAVAFHAGDEFYLHHRHLADLIFSRVHAPALTVLPTGALDAATGLLRLPGDTWEAR